MSTASNSILGARIIIGAVLVMFLWAICFPLITAGLSDAPPMVFAALRAAIAGGVLLLAARLARRPQVKGRNNWISVLLVGLTATSIGFFGMFYGGERVSPGLATVLANAQPLIAAALAWYYLKEHLNVRQQAGLVIGFAGIVLIAFPGMSGPGTQVAGALYILVGAIGIAISNVILKRLAGRVDPIWAMGWQLLFGSIPLAFLALAVEDVSMIYWSSAFIYNLLTLSVLGTSVAFWLWFLLLDRATLSRLNVFTFLTPIFGLLLGAQFFEERIGALGLLGIGMSLLGIFLVGGARPGAELSHPRTATAGSSND